MAKKKSTGSRSSHDSSNVFQLMFQVLVVGVIAWFIYTGYSGRPGHHAVHAPQAQPSVKSAKEKPALPHVVKTAAPSVKEEAEPEADEIVRDVRRQPAAPQQTHLEDRPDSQRIKKEQPPAKLALATPPPKRVYKKRQPRIAFVIDDIGHITDFLPLVYGLGDKITYAILPDLQHSKFFDKLSLKTGADVILHLPLEVKSGRYPGPGLVRNSMTEQEVIEMLDHDFESAPHAVGANNHMGSSGSANRRLMEIILRDFKRRNKFFLDSYTTKDSVIMDVGKSLGMTINRRDVFLDNTDQQSYIRGQLRQLADIAYRKGFAIGIGHYRYNTLKVLSEEIPRLEDSGYVIVPLSELYQK